jgi:hypothetical protein
METLTFTDTHVTVPLNKPYEQVIRALESVLGEGNVRSFTEMVGMTRGHTIMKYHAVAMPLTSPGLSLLVVAQNPPKQLICAPYSETSANPRGS